MNRSVKCGFSLIVFIVTFDFHCCTTKNILTKAEYRHEIEKWLKDIDVDFRRFNSLASRLTWELSVNPENVKYSEYGKELTLIKNRWRNAICGKEIQRDWLTGQQRRKMFLLCRGGKFTDKGIVKYIETMGELAEAYGAEICLPSTENFVDFYSRLFANVSVQLTLPQPGDCLSGEPDLEILMKRQDLNADQLRWIWHLWHNSVGPRVKKPFLEVVDVLNRAARANGYLDNGEVWREELETPNLEEVVDRLYSEIEPLYKMLHSVVRYKLYEKFGPSEIDLKGPIPIHLLGNMWGQDWSYLIGLFMPKNFKILLNERLQSKNLTMRHMVLEAEDFYASMGMPRMTRKFWKYSILQKKDNTSVCHGTAANLYNDGDFRIMMCGQPGIDDFYVIHHEMGHIEYYMAYEQQPAVFQEGTNTAFHESIGDAIMHGVMTPQHLHRISLLRDEELFDSSTDFALNLLQGLEKIAEIPFALLIDKYRWKIFSGEISRDKLNEAYWKMNRMYRGVVPPEGRGEVYFDAGAKFHIPDGTPYIRYFLSGILQMDLFKSLCEITVLGGNSRNKDEEKILPLQRCDIYGSKKAGKHLRRVMALGSSVHWSVVLNLLTGHSHLTTRPFLQYYEPVYKWLKNYVEAHNLYVGW
ncbi:angiotensin-converting enzyme-like [Coccinella septempunctata]|uniref:angiotensin-converting enzyme-like n=1 Tax=Coccinella septempunctata TaxID=41139 RepID=UPI001D06E89E|nr:angiotensin-converting enzyme-like [Coccinella septempunctata]